MELLKRVDERVKWLVRDRFLCPFYCVEMSWRGSSFRWDEFKVGMNVFLRAIIVIAFSPLITPIMANNFEICFQLYVLWRMFFKFRHSIFFVTRFCNISKFIRKFIYISNYILLSADQIWISMSQIYIHFPRNLVFSMKSRLSIWILKFYSIQKLFHPPEFQMLPSMLLILVFFIKSTSQFFPKF